jgi:hypothetical protein
MDQFKAALRRSRAEVRSDLRKIDEWTAPWAPYWTKVRAISNTGAARAVIIVPLVGYWIILNDLFVQKLTRLSPLLVGKMSIHTPWQLFAIYFGLWLVGVGSAFYQLFCPPEVKRHASSSEYVGEIAPRISVLEMQRVDAALRDGDQTSKNERQRIDARIKAAESRIPPGEKPDMDQVTLIQDQGRRDLLLLHFDLCNRRSATARLIVAALYIVGFTALALPSLSVFHKVVVVAIDTGFGAHPQQP